MKGAPDQRNQLARYIEIALNYSYPLEQIYIVYLPLPSKDVPDEEADPWISPITKKSYQDVFADRFKVVKSDKIREWVMTIKESTPSLFDKRDKCIIEELDYYLQDYKIKDNKKHGYRDFFIDNYYLKNDSMDWLMNHLDYQNLESSNMEEIKIALIDNDHADINGKIWLLLEYLNISYACRELKKNRLINIFISQLEFLREQMLKDYINKSNDNLYADKVIESKCFPYLDRNCHICYRFTTHDTECFLYVGNNKRNDDTRFFCSIIAGKDLYLPDTLVDLLKPTLKDIGRSKKWMARYLNEGDYSTIINVLNEVLKKVGV